MNKKIDKKGLERYSFEKKSDENVELRISVYQSGNKFFLNDINNTSTQKL
jgi:hypothetical protein